MGSNLSLLNYLHYHYLVLNNGTRLGSPLELFNITPVAYQPGGDLVEEGSKLLRLAFEKQLGGTESREAHVVPLSGGLDSRAILAGLLEAGVRKRVIAVTFGTPKTLDYEIGSLVAREFGVHHEHFDLTQSIPNTEDLLDAVNTGGAWTYLFDAYFNRLIPKRYGASSIYWSGYMGDRVAGPLKTDKPCSDWDEAKAYFAKRQAWARSVNLTPPGYDPGNMLPPKPHCFEGQIDAYEQLNILVRQQHCIRRIVFMDDRDFRTPFLDPHWVAFMGGLPAEFRKGRGLYHRILAHSFPRAMMLPTKTNYGLPLLCNPMQYRWRRMLSGLRRLGRRYRPFKSCKRPHPMTNYIDYGNALRRDRRLQKVVKENLNDLRKRNLVDWIPIDLLWDVHQKSGVDHSDAILLLVGLEVNLKAVDRLGPRA